MSALDKYIEYLGEFSTQEKHFLKLYKDSTMEDYRDIYFYPSSKKFEVVFKDSDSIQFTTVVELLNYIGEIGYDATPLGPQLDNLVTARIHRSHSSLDRAADIFGGDYVAAAIKGWEDFGNSLKSMVDRMLLRKDIKAVK